ncbi:DUF2975 domain-containing protein [Photobacterium damselae]|uniref:DUF2975 domain-containing protein n=1 Tax=Photobacterium damselae TaxID=38293 RepID=UPI001110A5EC|nr:DUF2975 domain-containing protein [Photobacterium damselae]TMX46649.1 DUF2975 domain-containing protein [Photobacterium damselae]
MTNIQKQSRRVRLFFQCLLFLTPIGVCYYWLTGQTPNDFLTMMGFVQTSIDIGSYTQQPLTMMTRILAMISSLLLSGVILYALRVLIHLFKNYEQNEIFTLDNAKCYRKLGYSIFYWVGSSVVYGTAMSVILSFNNPPGERLLTVTFAGIDFLTLIFGMIILIISWVMQEGFRIADENNHTI